MLITQENHLITNLEMIQSCIVSMQVATCAMIVVYRQNKQAQITAELTSCQESSSGKWRSPQNVASGGKVQGERVNIVVTIDFNC